MRKEKSMIRWCVVLAFLVMPVCAAGQGMSSNVLDYLILPDPDCGLQWCYQSTFSDPLLSDPYSSLVLLKSQLRETGAITAVQTAHLKLDAADVYFHLDSLATADRHATEAVIMLERSFARQQTAECAYLIARAHERLEKNEIARQWYERAIDLNREYYQAYFEIVDDLPFSDEAQLKRWIERTQRLAERLIRSDHDSALRADVAYQYAMMRANLIMKGGVGRFFEFAGEYVRAPKDSVAFERFMRTQVWTAMCPLCGQEIVDLLKTAVQLQPNNTQYQIVFTAAELGHLFFSSIERMKQQPDASSLSVQEMFDRGFSNERENILTIRSRLLQISALDRVRFPVVHLYLSLTDALLGEYHRAYETLKKYLRLQPDNQCAHAMLCGVVEMIRSAEPITARGLIDEFMTIGERKCLEYPSGPDCYRLGYLKWYVGDLKASLNLFRLAAFLDEKNSGSRLAAAIIALKLGEVQEARVIARSLGKKGSGLGSEKERVCYHILMAVLAAQDGDLPSARYWAEEALKLKPNLTEAKALLEQLHRR